MDRHLGLELCSVRCTPRLMVALLLLISFHVTAQNRIFLSGKDADDAKLWDFRISAGRNSGYWTKIPVPSNWELKGFGYYTYGRDYENYREAPEIGFYRKTFQLEKTSGKRYRLTFEGVMTDTHVKVNGKRVGEVHQGGFTRFYYEITDYVKEGENTLEVEVHKSSANMSIQKSERNADYWLFGGIYRPVYIDVLPSEFVERVAVDAKMDGLFNAHIYLNDVGNGRQVEAKVFDLSGEPAGRSLRAEVDKKDKMVQISGRFSNVQPWSHEFPNLYKLVVTLRKRNEVIHTFTQKFGFRTFEVRDHDGFYLNNKRILLKGANMHSFRPGSGRALSYKDIEANFRLLKELNFNCVRPCHYPPDRYFFDLCDSLGLLAMDELPGWHEPLQTEIGAELVKELVIRDVNHPSIILWSNGNHQSHNPELDQYFFQWDIQKRRPLKNAAKKERIFENYTPPFDIVDTRFYPSYNELVERLNGEHIVLPNEALHALYDGGGGASLKDYWDAFKASKVGGGLMIWSLFDECVIRTDEGFRLDCQQNKAPDGLVGPGGEKEGSYYAVKEIWSPVQFDSAVIKADFNGTLKVTNDFSFVNLKQCRFVAHLLDFTAPNEAAAGHRKEQLSLIVNDIPAGEQGEISIELPQNWRDHDAIRLKAWDNQGNEINTWHWPIHDQPDFSIQFVGNTKKKIKQDPDDPFLFQVGNTRFKFNGKNGNLDEVTVGDESFPFGSSPFLVYRSESASTAVLPQEGEVTVRQKEGAVLIESNNTAGFDKITWKIMPQGYLNLSYAYTLPAGSYHYAGIGLNIPDKAIIGKRWLGEGPDRIWKNRMEGGTLDVWDTQRMVNIPGKTYNPPVFEGYFAPWFWSIFKLKNDHAFGLSATSDGLHLGISTMVNGAEPKFAVWQYPEQEGIYLFNYISPVGAKWRSAGEFGPSGQLNMINGTCKGSINLYFDWNKADLNQQLFKVEIE